MSDGKRLRAPIAIAIVVLVALGVYWLKSGALMRWLLALHGRH